MFIHELHHSIRGEKITRNPMLLTPKMTNMAISRKGAKTHKIYIYAKTAKIPLAEWQKIRMALASDFLIALEQVVLTPAWKPNFQTQIMTSSSTKPAKFNHKVHKDLHRVAQRKNIKKK